MEDKFNNLQLQDKTDINILLLGETGVGKSTFINSFANYLHYRDLEKAINEPPFVLIPCMFNIYDDKFQLHKVTIGSDVNECLQVGDSATQDVKTYVFPIWGGKTRIRLIDTPGMGDPRGVEQDDINCENILSYIGQLHELHAICFLFKPNDSRVTVTFEYCVKQILSRLEKSASQNIIFLFTNTKGTQYKPGETIACLKRVVEEIKKQPPHVDIKIKENVFCFENEAFRYLGAVKQGIQFETNAKEEFSKSWKNSTEQAWKLINYIVGDSVQQPLRPHFVKNSTCINEARRVINQLAQPLADISQLIFDNLRILDRRRMELQHQNLSLNTLKSKLYVPIINLKSIKLTQPATVCCDPKCAELVLIDGLKTWNYKQRCHDPCHLRNVPQEIIGAPQLQYCTAMNKATQTCLRCGCPQTVHMHIYYMTEKFDDKKIDASVQSRINSSEKALAEAERIINEIKKRKTELESEKDVIINCAVKFASFLQANAITPFNDAYRKYIEYMIIREESLGKNADMKTIYHWKSLLNKYDEMKSTFDKVIQLSASLGQDAVEVDAKCVTEQLEKLYSLKHNGQKIKELYLTQKTSRKKEYSQSEYLHPSPVLDPVKYVRQSQSDIEGTEKKRQNSKTRAVKRNVEFKKNKNFNVQKQNIKKNVLTTDSNRRYGYSSGRRDGVARPDVPPSYGNPGSSYSKPYNSQSYNNQMPQENRPSYRNLMHHGNEYREDYHNGAPYNSRPPHDSRQSHNRCYGDRQPPHGGAPFNDDRVDIRQQHMRPPHPYGPERPESRPIRNTTPYDDGYHYDYDRMRPYDNRPSNERIVTTFYREYENPPPPPYNYPGSSNQYWNDGGHNNQPRRHRSGKGCDKCSNCGSDY
ncbi:hypothetical protein HHI36_007137 [Cryptolaemus montrouzieri]|uniref:DUF8206 domain-containing protein n=1 Tax=Cryptolaemus montrouzieri TaxID=559131 RepID=A0ABD2MNS8_9CUCU